MESMECWNIFERTGSIEAYLNYTACTKEEQVQNLCENDREDIVYGNTTCTSWDGFISNASGGI